MSKPDLATRIESARDETTRAALEDPAHPEDAMSAEYDVETAVDDLGSYELCESEIEAADCSTHRVHSNGALATGNGRLLEVDGEPQADAGSSDSDPGSSPKTELRGWPRFEAWVERLAHKYKFIRKITSRLYLPIAFHSGLTMKKLDPHTFTYVLPFRRFNRNFYDAMAGAALVANSEIAAGMYLFGELGGKWTVVCKNISYRFLRPCLGPAIYKVNSLDDIKARLQAGVEFNIDLTLEILQQVSGKKKQPRVGRCEVTFHCAPKGPEGNRGLSRRRRRKLR